MGKKETKSAKKPNPAGGNPLNIESHEAPPDSSFIAIEGSQLNNGQKTIARVSVWNPRAR